MPARGNAPGIATKTIMSALKGRKDPAPLQGTKRSADAGTQGVALGYHAPALSAPGDVELLSRTSQVSRCKFPLPINANIYEMAYRNFGHRPEIDLQIHSVTVDRSGDRHTSIRVGPVPSPHQNLAFRSGPNILCA